MKNKYILSVFLFLFASCFVSCSSDDNEDIIDETKEYKLFSVRWEFDEDNGVEKITEKLEDRIVYNYGTTKKWVDYDPFEEVEQTSFFECEMQDVEFLDKWLSKDTTIYVPSNISFPYWSMFSSSKVPLDFMKKFGIELTLNINDSVELPPNTKITYRQTLYYNKVTATCYLVFVTKDGSFEKLEVAAKWTGMLYDHDDSGAVVSEIK